MSSTINSIDKHSWRGPVCQFKLSFLFGNADPYAKCATIKKEKKAFGVTLHVEL